MNKFGLEIDIFYPPHRELSFGRGLAPREGVPESAYFMR